MSWRLAESLVQLRKQVNEALPTRDKSSDGSIGDEAHASRSSDHNPWVIDSHGLRVVTAIDITHDPKGGFDSYAFADFLRKQKEGRIKYIISNRRIAAFDVSPWQWRKYSGTNPHDHHVHISARSDEALYDNVSPWDLIGFGFVPNDKAPPVPSDPVLSLGAKGASVEELQRFLKIELDGVFGPKTDAAVRFYQMANGLAPDGVVGVYTWAKLKKGK